MATKDQTEADENMSASGMDDGDDAEKQALAWKKIVNKLKYMPSKRHARIRELVVEAISAARKAQLKTVVGQLRAALLEFHPQAAGACKTSALAVLESHGGYDDEDDDEDIDDEEEVEDPQQETAAEEEVLPSSLSADAVIANASLDGIEDSTHEDWVTMVKAAKTISRMGTLVSAFVKRATEKLKKNQDEHESLLRAIDTWEKEEERRARNEAKNGTTRPSKDLGVSEGKQ